MIVEKYETEFFNQDGRGPTLARWIHDNELLFPNSNSGFAEPSGGIVGAHYYLPDADEGSKGHWLIFEGIQVIQVVPEEVHSFWHYSEDIDDSNGLFKIVDSPWKQSFNQTHLAKCDHFIVEFCDQIVEVICTGFTFGEGEFQIEAMIEDNPSLSYAYLRKAQSAEKSGDIDTAKEMYGKYIESNPEVTSKEYAERCLAGLIGK